MMAAVYHNTPSLSVPPTQDTAPVLEFTCLYTHNVTKKAKKWQDGFMRYHTFNKRVMVYDIPGNFIGDTHWTGHDAVQQGDEITLESWVVAVQVGENRGQTETDLTELRQSRKRPPSGVTLAAGRPVPVVPAGSLNSSSIHRPTPTQLKHRSLNALLGSPKGPIGKAQLPQRSPFEEKQARKEPENQEWEDGRRPKRARVGSVPAWNITRIIETPRAFKQSGPPLWGRMADAAKQRRNAALQSGQQGLGARYFIELSDDGQLRPSDEPLLGFCSDAITCSSLPGKERTEAEQKSTVRSRSPGFQTQFAESSTTPSRRALSQNKPREQVETLPPESGEKITKSRVSSVKLADASTYTKTNPKLGRSRENVYQATSELSASPKLLKPSKPPSSKPPATIRLAESKPRKQKMLLCQDQLTKKLNKNTLTDMSTSTNALSEVPTKEDISVDTNLRRTPDERLAAIDGRNVGTGIVRLNAPKTTLARVDIGSDETIFRNAAMGSHNATSNSRSKKISLENSALTLSRLDHMMLLPPAPLRQFPVPSPQLLSELGHKTRSTSPRKQTRSSEQRAEQPLRRMLSEVLPAQASKPKCILGATARYIPTTSPTKRSHESAPVLSRPGKPTKTDPGNPAPPHKTSKQRKPLQKSVTLNVTSNGTSTVILSKPFHTLGKRPEEKEKVSELPIKLGPWSREAFDLFTWRPPNWNEEKWSLQEAAVEKE